jgi:RNA polymerase sigma-70 factor (ECF subfamily)
MVLAATVDGVAEVAAARRELDVSAIYVAHGAFIGRVIRRLAGNGPQVDDLLQETFIVAHKKRAEFDERADITTWLYGIAANLCRRHRRGLSRFARLKERFGAAAEIETSEVGDQPDVSLERREAVQAVRDAIAKLPFKQREVFVLFELEGLEGQEIAGMTGVPVGTVWTRLKKARETVTKVMRRQARIEDAR